MSKISVKHFLNKNLKGKVLASLYSDGPFYPLYVRLRYKGKKTEFKSLAWDLSDNYKIPHFSHYDLELNEGPYMPEKFFKENVESDLDNEYKKERQIIYEIIDFYARNNINIIGQNTSAIIHLNTASIDQVYSDYLVINLSNESSENTIQIQASFLELYEWLFRIASDNFISTVLEKYRPSYEALKILYAYSNEQGGLKVYQWKYDNHEDKFKALLKRFQIKFFEPQIEEINKAINDYIYDHHPNY